MYSAANRGAVNEGETHRSARIDALEESIKEAELKPKLPPDRRYGFFLILLIALCFATFPEPVSAADCQTYHWVQEGQTTAYIAKTYGFKWAELAELNGMHRWAKPEIGQRLCIPPKKEPEKPAKPDSDPLASVNVYVSADRIYIVLNDFKAEHVYRVKVRDAKKGIGNWVNLAMIEVSRNTEQKFAYDVPASLRGVPMLNLCFKDMVSNELICHRAENK